MSITKHPAVVAIELGRLESGCAISTMDDFKRRPTFCRMCGWHDQFLGRKVLKTPTSILFDPKKNFNSFGLEAVNRYSDLVSENEQQNWLFFPHFKMQLYKKSISGLNLTLESKNGETMDALTVYSAAIRYLKDYFWENSRNAFDEKEVLFVLPVPAIWSEQAQQLMRESAEKAGIKKDNILIVLESDAAALYCEYFSAEEIARSNVKRFRAFQPGSKYIVMDAEDGSIDITAHEVKRNNKILEVLKVNDVAWEVTRVDEAFRSLLEDLFGEKVIQEFSQEHEHDMLELFESFATKKKTIKPELREKIFIRIPPLLIDTFRKLNNGKEFYLALEDKPKYAGKISLTGNKMRMDPAIAKDLFTDTMNNIVCLMRKLMQDEIMRDAEFILMVGGFSESPMLVHAIREAFPQKVMISPREADFSVIKGALNLGHLQLEIDHHTSDELPMAETEPFVVVAIDFGTTYSGYAFSFRHDFKRDPTKCTYTKWNSGIGGFQHYKTSTCVLFDDKRNFHSFGFEAEEKYANLALDNAHRKWFFFRRFKMRLYGKTSAIKRNFTLKADNGKPMEAMVVFSSAIRYLKDQLVEKLEEQNPSTISVNDMLFVLTVPAIWTYQAKQFMREAAEKAGITKQRLRLALEPEVASLYCKHLPKLEDECFIKPGTRYIILDAGGGTVDITAHEVENGGTLKEICKANGGDWGGTSIDNKFRKLLITIVGENVWALFEQEHKYDLLEMFTNFEIKKRTIKPGITDRVTFKAPMSLVQLFKKLNNGKEVDERVKEDGRLSWVGDKIRMKAETAKSLFTETSTEIFHHILQLTKDERVRKADFILMVGGFSECEMLISNVRKFLPFQKIIVPREAGLSVLKGALIYGHEPHMIDARICKYTYGISISDNFDETCHDFGKLYITCDGRLKCTDIFSKHAEIGQAFTLNSQPTEKSYEVSEAKQTEALIKFFESSEPNPKYVTDPSCTQIGILRLEMPGEGLGRSCTVRMFFSGTELEVGATNNKTGEKVSVTIDLLG